MTAISEHARKLLIFVRAAGFDVHIGPASRRELAADYELDANDIAGAVDYLSIIRVIRRDGTRLREVRR